MAKRPKEEDNFKVVYLEFLQSYVNQRLRDKYPDGRFQNKYYSRDVHSVVRCFILELGKELIKSGKITINNFIKMEYSKIYSDPYYIDYIKKYVKKKEKYRIKMNLSRSLKEFISSNLDIEKTFKKKE